MTPPYRYHTLDGSDCGYDFNRDLAKQAAARIAMRTGKEVEFVDRNHGTFRVYPWTKRRVRWRPVPDAERAA